MSTSEPPPSDDAAASSLAMTRAGPDLYELIAGCQTIEGLSSLDRARAREALQYLASEGVVPVVDGRLQLTHPMAMQFINQVAWTRKWLAWLSDALRAC